MADKGTISTLSIWSDDQKAVVYLRCEVGLNATAVANALGLDRQTVARRVQSAYDAAIDHIYRGFEVIWENPDSMPQMVRSRVPIEVDEH